jgi:hypothetical protein
MKMILSPALRPSVTVLSRSRRLLVAAMLPILVAGFLFAPVHAQTSTSAVPNLISYQGKVSDATGAFVGATTPVNRTVTFRIWSSPSSSTVTDLIYSEQQTVSISGGEFSVLIGQGSAVSGTPLGYSESAKHTTNKVGEIGVFATTTRYLGVTIDDGNSATTDPEISPRQQLVSSAYAFRAKYAESLGSSGVSTIKAFDSGNVGIGTDNPGAKLEVAGDIRAGGAGTLNPKFSLLANSATTVAASIGYANSAGTLSNDAAAIDTVFRTENGGKLLLQSGIGAAGLVIDATNKVGVGTAAPSAKLDVVSSVVSTPALRVKIATPGTGNVIQAENATSTVFVVQDTGNVGIGTSSPTAKLDVAGAVKATGIDVAGAVTVTGNVGIGTSSPTAKLDVAGNVVIGQNLTVGPAAAGTLSSIVIRDPSGSGTFGIDWIDNTNLRIGTASAAHLRFKTSNSERMRISADGNVGIGTTNPINAKLEVRGASSNAVQGTYYYINGGGGGVSVGYINYSIFADGRIACNEFNAFSDERIKLVRGRSVGASDLAMLMQIEITDYTFKDTIEKGSGPQKKVLGQQVEKVFPQAVHQGTDVVPDIYQIAQVKDGWLELATDLKKGDRVKLVTDSEARVYDVVEVEQTRFRTTLQPGGEKVFVYGREVKDFRVIDYDAIAMLNVSATQEIKREKDAEVAALRAANAALAATNAALERRLAEVETKDRVRDAKLSAIEKLLQSSSTVIALPAKSATASGQQ